MCDEADGLRSALEAAEGERERVVHERDVWADKARRAREDADRLSSYRLRQDELVAAANSEVISLRARHTALREAVEVLPDLLEHEALAGIGEAWAVVAHLDEVVSCLEDWGRVSARALLPDLDWQSVEELRLWRRGHEAAIREYLEKLRRLAEAGGEGEG